MSRAVAALVALAAAGCAFPAGDQVTSSTIAVAAFDVSCAVDGDCAAVLEGELCVECLGCPNATISASEVESYNAALQSARSRCTNLDPNVACATAPCLSPTVRCATGRCVVGP